MGFRDSRRKIEDGQKPIPSPLAGEGEELLVVRRFPDPSPLAWTLKNFPVVTEALFPVFVLDEGSGVETEG